MEDSKQRESGSGKWWQNPTIVGLLVAIIAAVAPVTAGVQSYFAARNQLDLERAKQAHEIRQKYLDRILSDVEGRQILQFLVAVEDDQKLKSWAAKQLEQTEQRIATKQGVYRDAIFTVASLANQGAPISKDSKDFLRFWSLYNAELLPFETGAVESLMVQIGNELNLLADKHALPSAALKSFSFQLARTMKQELPPEGESDQAGK